jgi:CDP-paratose 2-epimerase
MTSPEKILVTGSCGLIGSEVTRHFGALGYSVTGIDNNQRAALFGPEGETSWMLAKLKAGSFHYSHSAIDLRDREALSNLVKELRPSLIVHAAAQTSHDLAAQIPFIDFEINALGTLNLLEATRLSCPESPFVFMSTNKVYGDRPNRFPLVELDLRWDFAEDDLRHGINESLSIDQSTHSLFGVSKSAADLMVQEYGRYFNMPTCCLRGGCLTGPNQSGVELHGFLSYLVKCNVQGREYTVYGYGGKQVRDNIHAQDVAALIHEFWRDPRNGEVYNLGGGPQNSCSILEAFKLAEAASGRKMIWNYVDRNRTGDHICYYSDLRKIQAHYPNWRITRNLPAIISEITSAWNMRFTK